MQFNAAEWYYYQIEDTKTVRDLIPSLSLIPVTNNSSIHAYTWMNLLASDVRMTWLNVYGHCLWMKTRLSTVTYSGSCTQSDFSTAL